MQSVDPRIALITAQDRRLLMVGQGTMGMVLAAAEKAGLIPERTTTVEYGVRVEPAGSIVVHHSAESARDMTEILSTPEPEPNDQTYAAVTRTHTTYADTTTDWVPLSASEESHE